MNQYEIQIKMSPDSNGKVSSHGVVTVTLHGANSEEKITLNPKYSLLILLERTGND